MNHLKWLAIAGLTLLCVSNAAAQNYPTRPVTIVVPYAAGGATDLLARMIGQKLEQRLGKSFVVENRPGAGTVIAAQAVAKATPDGYTLLMGTSTPLAINATLHKKLSYDPAADFVPLALIANVPFVLVVTPTLPVKTASDLVKLAKEKPGSLSYGSSGPGSPHHLYAELLKSMTGIEMTHVPYKGSVPALTDVIANHIPLMFVDLAPAQPLIREGKVRALGVSSAVRVPSLPEVAPIAEVGVPGFEAVAWQMLVAPAGTPKEIVDTLHRELKAALALPEIKRQISEMGLIPIDTPPPEELARYVKTEIVRWGAVVKKSGASIE
ncbi:MAG: tripartite tricarboxylate transporter substrate binding protein [Rhizobiales bacterium]|nr:tripartite tricarboxylate transporter substrate binding protein [Hyphomicrobiales bacterium]